MKYILAVITSVLITAHLYGPAVITFLWVLEYILKDL